jgi:hypothetical protein
MSPASEIPSGEGGGGRSGPTRPFIAGREAGSATAHKAGGSFPRPFRTGSVAANATAAVQDEGGSSDPTTFEGSPGLPSERIEAVARAEMSADPVDELHPAETEREEERVPEADFAPLVSWDPLADVGWRAGPGGSEADNPADAPAVPFISDRAAVEPVDDFTAPGPGIERAAAEDTRSADDEFAAKLEAIAAAIRREKVDDLLAENPQDALTALVAGYYIGTLRRTG